MTYTERRSALLSSIGGSKASPSPRYGKIHFDLGATGFPLKEQHAAQRASMQRVTCGRLE
jgi:hypothetical protein